MIIEESGKIHYVLVVSQHKNTNHKYYYERCLIGYSRKDLLEQHIVECKGINERAIRIAMPTKRNKFVKFETHKNQLKAPWVIYADFEANTTKIEGPTQNTNYTKNLNFTNHVVLHYALYAAMENEY